MTGVIEGSCKVEGLAELEKALLEIGAVAGQRALRAAMLKAVQPMVEAARANALSIAKSGALALAMGARFKVEHAQPGFMRISDAVDAAVVYVGPIRSDRPARAAYTVHYGRGRRGKLARGVFHGHLVEFGTKRSRARPFLRPAFDSTREQVIERFVGELRRRIEKVKGG